jgi:hypothetical protein
MMHGSMNIKHNREYFTSYGLHLNGLGREVICNQNVSTAKKILQFEKVKPISMYWKLGLVDNTNLKSIDLYRNSAITVSKDNADNDCCSEKAENQEQEITQQQFCIIPILIIPLNHKIPQQYLRLIIS